MKNCYAWLSPETRLLRQSPRHISETAAPLANGSTEKRVTAVILSSPIFFAGAYLSFG
jgi:hypothetical protein